uniref:Uncharacterized protein LOC114341007 n=1 Tax=Diabrotica virgifera virgifera TaxID=50390 RepID=A0A6P7GDN4_DIAVI
MIGIYHGYEKPAEANIFLDSFVSSLIYLINNGIEIDGRTFSIKINSIVCDVPAKAFITYTKGHSGYASCSKCTIEGEFINNRICFPDVTGLNLRTDQDFRAKTQESHHSGTSVLENIPLLNMVDNFPLDPMHLISLGVVKKILVLLWCHGKPRTKLSFHHIRTISDRLVHVASQVPMEFNRKPRSLSDVRRWKATEFRQFLLYTGPVVLRGQINADRYQNFLSLHIAVTILSSRNHFQLLDYASDLLVYFVKTFIYLYGSEHVSHNVHNLLHLVDDVKRFGPLDEFGCWNFENYLQSILKNLRKPDKPLAQIIKRHSEKNHQNNLFTKVVEFPSFLKEHNDGPTHINVVILKQFKKLALKTFTLCTSEPDNCCCFLNGSIGIIENIILTENRVYKILAKKFLIVDDIYKEPCQSSSLGIYSAASLGPLEMFDMEEVKSKCVRFTTDTTNLIFPLLHCT